MASRSSAVGTFALLILGFVCVWMFIRSQIAGIEELIPVVRESRIPLILELSQAEQGIGYPRDTDFRRPFTDPNRNLDVPGVPFAMPLPGELAFRDLPAHPEARLSYGYGIELVGKAEAEGATISFLVEAAASDAPDRWHELARTSMQCGAVGAEPSRARHEAILPEELLGERIDLRLRTRSDRPLSQLALIPVFASPVLSSTGKEVRVEELSHTVVEVLDDLLGRYEAAVEQDDDWELVSHSTTREFCFAIRRDEDGTEHPPLPLETSGITASFETDDRFFAPRGGPMPALFFDFDHTIVRYPVEVPEDGATLEYFVGVDFRCIGVGSALFQVSVDGQTVARHVLNPENRPEQRGWLPVEIDLEPWAGQQILLGFHGEAANLGSKTIALTGPLPMGGEERYSLEVKRVRGAFGRPRIVKRSSVHPHLSRKGDRPSVVIVNVETFRRDAPACYGGIDGISPTLDRLAAEGLRVESCVTVAPWTSPSVASLLSGVHPWTHGVTWYAESFLADSVSTLAELASARGIVTAGFSSNELISAEKNYDQGFQTFFLAPYANGHQMVSTFEDWLEDHRDLQFLVYLHLFEPHHPYNAPGEDRRRYVPAELSDLDAEQAYERIQQRILQGDPPGPEEDDVRLMRALYAGEVRYLDRQLGRLRTALERAGLDERVVLIVTGDHGEEFCEHGLFGHGSHVYGESVEVPLVFWGPGIIEPGRTLAGPVENAALFGTVLELLGVPYDRQRARPALQLNAEQASGQAYTSTAQGLRELALVDGQPAVRFKPLHCLRTRSHSLIFSPAGSEQPAEFGLFDLAADPAETNSLVESEVGLLEQLKERMEKAYSLARKIRHGMRATALDARTMQAIGELGYLGGSAEEPGETLFGEQETEEEDG